MPDDRNMSQILKSGMEGLLQGLLIGVLLSAGIGGCVRGCARLIRSPDNPKLQVNYLEDTRSYSEYPGLTYRDFKPYGRLDLVNNQRIGEERYGTNLTARDHFEFNRLEKQAREEGRIPCAFED